MLLNLMRANNVEHTVLIQVIHYKWDNSYLADVLKRYPKRFRGVCRVNPQDPAAPDHLSRLTEVNGFRRSATETRTAPRAGSISKCVCEDLAHVVALAPAVP